MSTPLLDELEGKGPEEPMVGPRPILIDRIRLNGKSYIASSNRNDLERVCKLKGIPEKFIRYSEKHGKHYLRLRVRWKRK